MGGSISGVVWHDLCNPGADGEPAPTAAPEGCTGEVATGYRANGTREAGEPLLQGVKVTLASGSCSAAIGEAFTAPGEPAYAFIGLAPGDYCVVVDPLVEPNLSILIPGGWTAPAVVDGAITTTVTLGPGENKSGVDFGWDYQFLPGGSDAGVTPVADCNYAAEYLADITVPDDSIVYPGTPFVKTWRMRNSGDCPWGPGLTLGALVLVGGHEIGGPTSVALTEEVAPGETVDVSIPLVAPDLGGVYRGEWKWLVGGQVEVGVGADGQAPLFVQIVVPEAEGDLRRIVFPAGAEAVTVLGQVASPDQHEYVLRALEGQPITIEIQSAGDAANFSVVGLTDGEPLKRLENESRSWEATLRLTQDYRITAAVPGGVGPTDYTMLITILPAP
jgi:hypothetical protein